MDPSTSTQSQDGSNGDDKGKGRGRASRKAGSDTQSGLTLDDPELCQLTGERSNLGDSVEELTLDSLPEELSPRRRRVQAARNALRGAVSEETRALTRLRRQNELLLKRISGIKGISTGTVRMAEATIEACQDAMEAAATRTTYQGLLDDQLDILMLCETDWKKQAVKVPTISEAEESRSNRQETPEKVEAGVQTDPFFFSGTAPTPAKEPDGAEVAAAQQKRKAGSPAEGAEANRLRKRALRSGVARTQGSVPLVSPAGTASVGSGNIFPTVADTAWRVVAGRGRKKGSGQTVAVPRQTAAEQGGAAPVGTQGGQPVDKVARDRPAKNRVKPPAIAVKIPSGATYADTLKRIRGGATLTEDMGRVTVIRRTKTGDMLIELDKKSAACTEKMKEVVARTLGEGSAVKALLPRLDVEVRDLDDITTAGELKQAIRNSIGGQAPNEAALGEEVQVKALVKGVGGRQRAIVSLPEAAAKKVVRLGHLNVGWVSCRVRVAPNPPSRCYRCHRPGHIAAQCTLYNVGVVICRRCGESGHIMTACEKAMRCAACAEKGLP